MLEPLAPRALVGQALPMPDPEVRERPVRRRFTAEYKRRIVEEANAAAEPGAVGALLRREGLYSSHLVEWRRLYRAGALSGLTRPRGRPAPHPLTAENDRLRAAIERLEARLVRAEKVIAVQGNVSALLRELSLESAEQKDGR
jgi:transposase-like protein